MPQPTAQPGDADTGQEQQDGDLPVQQRRMAGQQQQHRGTAQQRDDHGRQQAQIQRIQGIDIGAQSGQHLATVQTGQLPRRKSRQMPIEPYPHLRQHPERGLMANQPLPVAGQCTQYRQCPDFRCRLQEIECQRDAVGCQQAGQRRSADEPPGQGQQADCRHRGKQRQQYSADQPAPVGEKHPEKESQIVHCTILPCSSRTILGIRRSTWASWLAMITVLSANSVSMTSSPVYYP